MNSTTTTSRGLQQPQYTAENSENELGSTIIVARCRINYNATTKATLDFMRVLNIDGADANPTCDKIMKTEKGPTHSVRILPVINYAV